MFLSARMWVFVGLPFSVKVETSLCQRLIKIIKFRCRRDIFTQDSVYPECRTSFGWPVELSMQYLRRFPLSEVRFEQVICIFSKERS